MKKLGIDFYDRDDVLAIARELIGKILVTVIDNKLTSGRIVETEAYRGVVDRASHAYGGRRTNRTEIMFGDPGIAYVYLCYGIHHLFNVVTNRKEIPHAILVRAVEPIEGISTMLKRTGKKLLDHTLTKGPGNVSKALGITVKDTGTSLTGSRIFLADDGSDSFHAITTPRIGVDYAGEDAKLPYRFILPDNPYISGKKISSR